MRVFMLGLGVPLGQKGSRGEIDCRREVTISRSHRGWLETGDCDLGDRD
jgi:hypothetical protein